MSIVLDPRKAFEEELVALGAKNDKILAVSCDSASGGGLGAYFQAYPERSVELGISEQNAVSMCASMSKEGFIPVLVIINPFLTMRAYEQIRNDVGYANTNVKMVGSGGGLAYSTLGPSHATIEDVAVMSTVPNLTILVPGDADEVRFALQQAVEIEGPVYIRMPRQARDLPKATSERNMVLNKAEVLREGKDVALFTYGPSVGEAMVAADALAKDGIDVAVIDLMTVKPIDAEAVYKWSTATKLTATLEEHCINGGIATMIAQIMATKGCVCNLLAMGLPEGFRGTGPYEELLDYAGISGAKAAQRIKEALK